MILGKRTVELQSLAEVPADLRPTVDRVLVLGGFPCSAVATRTSGPMVLAVGTSRAAALQRLHKRLRSVDRGARPRRTLEQGLSRQPQRR